MQFMERPERKIEAVHRFTPHFHIAAIHDSLANAWRALRLCDRLIHAFHRDFVFHVALCDFGSFQSSLPASPSMKYAAQARLVFIAADDRLPEAVWRWLDRWAAAYAERPIAVAALNGPSKCLQQFCGSRSVDLIDPLQNKLGPWAGLATKPTR